MSKRMNAEVAVEETLFFCDDVDEDRPFRRLVVDYFWPFQDLRAAVPETIAREMRNLIGAASPDRLNTDIACLLAARNWRSHALACLALALSDVVRGKLRLLLWMRIRLGCALSPQLMAAASVADPEFKARAQRLLTLRSTNEASASALVTLLEFLASSAEPPCAPQTPAVLPDASAKHGIRAIAWHCTFKRLRAAVPSP